MPQQQPPQQQPQRPPPPPPPQLHQPQPQRGAADNFARAVTRQAVAQAALAVGCKASFTSVLDALTDMVQDFVQTVGLAAQAKAEAGGRTQVSVLDVVAALEEPPLHDGRDRYEVDWRALRGFAFRDVTQPDRPEAFQWYQPFHTHIPPFPVSAGPGGGGSSRKRARAEEGPTAAAAAAAAADADPSQHERRRWRRPAYVPSFLPAFPPEHTFRKTGIKATSKVEDPAAIQQHRIATKQLILRAMQRATAGSGAGAGASNGRTSVAGTRRGRSGASRGKPEGDEAEEEGERTEGNGEAAGDGLSVVSLPEMVAAAGAAKDDDTDLFSAEAQPFKPVAAAAATTTTKPAGAKSGATVGGARS